MTMENAVFRIEPDEKLTVITKNDVYKIECRPQNFPTFKRDEVKFVYRFDVDFVADSPYWQKGAEILLTLSNAKTLVYSNNNIDLPMKIIFPAGVSTLFNVNGKGFTLKAHDIPLTVNTQNFKVTNAGGQNCNQYIDATAQLDEVYFKYGQNKIICSPFNNVQIFYYNLSFGEI